MLEKKVMSSISILHPSLRNNDRSKEFKDYEYLTSDNPDSVVTATNELAEKANGNYLMFVADDLKLPKNWDKELLKFDPDKPLIIRPSDGLQRDNAQVITFPIMTREAYNQLGYFFYHEYKSMWVDVDLWWIAYTRKWLVDAPDLQWEHLHHSVGKSKKDKVYEKSESYWNQGADIFNKRAVQFGWSKRASYR